jgi:hypothetical protein
MANITEGMIVVPAGCCRRTCLNLIIGYGLSQYSATLLLEMQAETGLPLVDAFQRLHASTVKADEAFKLLAEKLPAKVPDCDLRDKVDRKGRRESQTHFFDKLPRRKR